MALQPASGAKDLNPKQVETNHLLVEKITQVFRLWGYEEVAPPRVERLATLMAGGAISNEDIVKIVSDDSLGLRPEMTASIARAACTRFANRPRPLRLFATGTVFESRETAEEGTSIEENLQCGVELLGAKGINAEMELLTLLLEAMERIGVTKDQEPTLLIGDTSLMRLILSELDSTLQEKAKNHLINYDVLALRELELDNSLSQKLLSLHQCRGKPSVVLNELEDLLGKSQELTNIRRLFSIIEPLASSHGIEIQLDPTFQPHFELYTGIVFQLICKGISAPVVISRGGRYDDLVQHFGARGTQAAGLGFSFAIDRIRELLIESIDEDALNQKIIITYSKDSNIEEALKRQNYWHKKGQIAQVELEPYENEQKANLLKEEINATKVEWLN